MKTGTVPCVQTNRVKPSRKGIEVTTMDRIKDIGDTGVTLAELREILLECIHHVIAEYSDDHKLSPKEIVKILAMFFEKLETAAEGWFRGVCSVIKSILNMLMHVVPGPD